jgi:hypothetical protein
MHHYQSVRIHGTDNSLQFCYHVPFAVNDKLITSYNIKESRYWQLKGKSHKGYEKASIVDHNIYVLYNATDEL